MWRVSQGCQGDRLAGDILEKLYFRGCILESDMLENYILEGDMLEDYMLVSCIIAFWG